MAKKKTVLARLTEEGFFTSREEALPWVMSGAVLVGQTRVKSLMEAYDETLKITVKGFEMPYVSKGGLKLEGAIKDFRIDVQDRVCIDAGACTGGFTDCFLKHGAAKVYAVEVGFGQLNGSLRQSERVVNLEKTNISDESLLMLDPRPTLGSVDLSYLSLRKGVPYYKAIMHGVGELICLVKPLFEVADSNARRTGEIDPTQYETVLDMLIGDLNAQEDTHVINVTHSRVTGNNGTHEFFLHVGFGSYEQRDLKHEIKAAVENVSRLAKFKK